MRACIARSFERARIETQRTRASTPRRPGIARSFERARIETYHILIDHPEDEVSPAHLSGRGLKRPFGAFVDLVERYRPLI